MKGEVRSTRGKKEGFQEIFLTRFIFFIISIKQDPWLISGFKICLLFMYPLRVGNRKL